MTVARMTLPDFAGRCPRSGFHSRRAEPGVVVVTAHGDIDAANADDLVALVASALEQASRVVLDCAGVTFFAIEGFTALQRVNVMCARSGATWLLVPSRAVSRVLNLCHPPEPAVRRRPLRLVSDR